MRTVYRTNIDKMVLSLIYAIKLTAFHLLLFFIDA
jgi:hypothetical protein